MAKSQDLTHITRFEYGNTRAWWVRFEGSQAPIRKLFSDGRYGGSQKALVAAVKFRDEYRDSLPPAPPQWDVHAPNRGRVFRERRSYKNTAGEHVHYDAWSARIRILPGKDHATSYSVAQWGDKGAKRMAERWLKEQQVLQKRTHPAFSSARKASGRKATSRKNRGN